MDQGEQEWSRTQDQIQGIGYSQVRCCGYTRVVAPMILVRSGHILKVLQNILEIICEDKTTLMRGNALEACKNCSSLQELQIDTLKSAFDLQMSFLWVLMSFLPAGLISLPTFTNEEISHEKICTSCLLLRNQHIWQLLRLPSLPPHSKIFRGGYNWWISPAAAPVDGVYILYRVSFLYIKFLFAVDIWVCDPWPRPDRTAGSQIHSQLCHFLTAGVFDRTPGIRWWETSLVPLPLLCTGTLSKI